MSENEMRADSAETEALERRISDAREQLMDRQLRRVSVASGLSAALAEIGDHIHETKKIHEWDITTPAQWDDKNQIPADLALIHSEVSEALEAFRKGDLGGFSEELSDVFIRLVGLAHGLQIDLGAGAWWKAEKNRDRPFKHGGKRL